MKFFLVLALILAVGIIVFTAQNQTDITLNFMSWELSYSVPVMLALPFFVGTLAGMALIAPLWMKRGKTGKVQKKRIHELETELASLSEHSHSEEPEVEQIEQIAVTEEETR